MVISWSSEPSYDADALWRAVRLALAAHSADPPRAAPRSATSARPEQDAFEAFFWKFERRIFGYLWRMTSEEQTAFDLTQEVFLRAWQHFDDVGTFADAGPWLFRVAANLALTYLRQRSKYPVIQLDEDALVGNDPTAQVITRDAVLRVLGKLTPQQRSALVLHEVYGLTCDEIGETLSISRAAVKMTLWRAREQFRSSYLQEHG